MYNGAQSTLNTNHVRFRASVIFGLKMFLWVGVFLELMSSQSIDRLSSYNLDASANVGCPLNSSSSYSLDFRLRHCNNLHYLLLLGCFTLIRFD